MKSTGSNLVRGFQCSPKVDLNADFFVSIVRNQELGYCLVRRAARRIAGLFFRDMESFERLPVLWVIVD